jgi:hypothetical protein
MQKSKDNQGHRTKLCFLPDCKGTVIPAGHVARHLKAVHDLSDAELKCWKASLGSYIRDFLYDPAVEAFVNSLDTRSLRSKYQ